MVEGEARQQAGVDPLERGTRAMGTENQQEGRPSMTEVIWVLLGGLAGAVAGVLLVVVSLWVGTHPRKATDD